MRPRGLPPSAVPVLARVARAAEVDPESPPAVRCARPNCSRICRAWNHTPPPGP